MIPEELRGILLADAAVAAVVGTNVYTRPLKRAGDSDPELAGWDPTPDAFETVPPYFVRPSIVIGEARGALDPSPTRAGTYLGRWVVTLAYYVAPDAETVLEQLAWDAGVAIDRQWIDTPSSRKGRVVVPHLLSTTVPVPEFPQSGKMATEDVEIAHVRAR